MDNLEDSQALDQNPPTGMDDDSSLDSSSGSDDSQKGGGLTPEEQLHREKSRHGREIAALRNKIESLEQSLNALSFSRPQGEATDDEPPVKYITTPAELEAYNEWKSRQQEQLMRKYTLNYVQSVKSLAYLSPDLHKDIEHELMDSGTQYHTHTSFRDPMRDAELNYRIAENVVLKRKLADVKKPPPIKGGSKGATGVTVTSQDAEPGGKTVELDPYARKFVEAMGEKPDAGWVQKSVQREDL